MATWNVKPIIYRGQRFQSVMDAQSIRNVIPWRLCISPLLGSSRMTLFVMMISSLQLARIYKGRPLREPPILPTKPRFSFRG
jgi:hypothetical protein